MIRHGSHGLFFSPSPLLYFHVIFQRKQFLDRSMIFPLQPHSGSRFNYRASRFNYIQSACNARDPGSVPGWGRSAGEGIGYPLQCSWASLMAQLVKNPPAMWESWVRSLRWEDPLEKGKATHSSVLGLPLWLTW